MKKNYIQPALRVVKVQKTHVICASEFNTVNTNLSGGETFDYGGGGNQNARTKDRGLWGETDGESDDSGFLSDIW